MDLAFTSYLAARLPPSGAPAASPTMSLASAREFASPAAHHAFRMSSRRTPSCGLHTRVDVAFAFVIAAGPASTLLRPGRGRRSLGAVATAAPALALVLLAGTPGHGEPSDYVGRRSLAREFASVRLPRNSAQCLRDGRRVADCTHRRVDFEAATRRRSLGAVAQTAQALVRRGNVPIFVFIRVFIRVFIHHKTKCRPAVQSSQFLTGRHAARVL